MRRSVLRRRGRADGRSEWNQIAGFPIIASAIERLSSEPDQFISKRAIVPLLLHEPHSRKLIEKAYKEKSRRDSIETYAGNMVQWFGEKWTVGDERWESLFKKFDRSPEKIDG